MNIGTHRGLRDTTKRPIERAVIVRKKDEVVMRDGVEYRNAPSLAGKRFDCTGVDTSPSSRTPSILVRMCPFPDCHLAFA